MNQQHFGTASLVRVYATVAALLLALGHLAWEHFTGGVQSHHLLQSAAMPAVSNGWGAAVLPALTWFLVGRIQKRASPAAHGRVSMRSPWTGIIAGFLGALTFGIALSVAFAQGYATMTTYLFFGALLLAVVLPLYRAECVLGFVLGMTFTFGAVLPTVIGSLIAALSACFSLIVYPALRWLAAAIKRAVGTTPANSR